MSAMSLSKQLVVILTVLTITSCTTISTVTSLPKPIPPKYPEFSTQEKSYLQSLIDKDPKLKAIILKILAKDAQCRAYSHSLEAVINSVKQ